MKVAHRVVGSMGRAVAVLAAGAAAIAAAVHLYVAACGVAAPAAAHCVTAWGATGGALGVAATLGLAGAALGWWRFLSVLGTILVAAGAPFYEASGLIAVTMGILHLVAAWAAHRGALDPPRAAFTRG